MAVVFYSWRQAVIKSKLAATTKHVLVTLGCHMNDMGESCFPSIETLMEETSLSNRAIITHLDKAEAAGFIVTRKHGYAGKRWARNEYVATFPDIENHPDNSPDFPVNISEKAVNDVHHLEVKAVNVVPEGSEPNDIKAVNVVHTSSSINYSINNSNPREATSTERNKQSMKPEGLYACRLIKLNVGVTSMHPTLHAWIRDGIDLDLLVECVGIARQQKPGDERIAPNYLDKIVRGQLKPKVDNSWQMTDDGVMAKGREVGIDPKVGESMQDYRARVKRAADGSKAA